MNVQGVLATVLTLFVLMGAASSVTTVCPEGCNYTDLREAVAAVPPGEMLSVQGGIYQGPVDVNKRLTLRGVGEPVVDAEGESAAIILSSNGTALDGFTAVNSTGPGIDIQSGENVVISNIAAYSGTGIRVDGARNVIVGNNGSHNDYGILIEGSGNVVCGNTAQENDYGIYSRGSNNSIFNNSLRENALSAYDSGSNLWSGKSGGNYYGGCDGECDGECNGECNGECDACSPMEIPGGLSIDPSPLAVWPGEAVDSTVTPLGAYNAMQEAVLLDIRTPEEYAGEHINGAVNSDYYSEDFRKDLGVLDRGRQYIIYCRTGYRTKIALEIMGSLGFEDVRSISGGIHAWMDAGLPVTSPS